jgi:hypothetical protein
MRAVCVTARLCIMALAVMIVMAVSALESTAYDTATGVKPEVQAKQTVDSQTRSISNFEILREPDCRYEEIADILIAELGLTAGDLSEQNDTTDQIIIGDISNSTIATLAADFNVSAADLGEEGYSLVSRPNPESSNGSWIVFILGAEGGSRGVLQGAYTLLDLLEENGNDEIGNYRIRDYPDRPFRCLMHWIQGVSGDGAAWVVAKKARIEEIAGTGCNALFLGSSDFWRMDTVHTDGELIGRWMNETAYWSRYYGMEPIPEVWACPYAVRIQHPLWREGECIKDDTFNVVYDGEGYVLEAAIPPFDNDAHNMDLESGETWPDGWTCSNNWLGWSYLTGDDRYLHFSGSNSTYPQQIWNASELEPGSFYVLECVFSDVDTAHASDFSPWLMVRVKNTEGDWHFIFHEEILDRTGSVTRDFFFWTPPDSANAPDGYPGNWDQNDFHPYYDHIEEIGIMIYRNQCDAIEFNVHGLFLERRAGALRNVMLDPNNELDLTITDMAGSPYAEDADYTIDLPDEELHWRMPTHRYDGFGNPINNITSIQWINEVDIPSQVLVSYTAGVPADWWPGGQKTTMCLKNEEYLDYIKDVLEDFYEPYDVDVGGLADYTLNPKYLDIRIDEVRGTNRCGRCADFDANGEEIQDNHFHFTDYIATFQGMLDDLALEYPAAAQTKLIVSDNMLSRFRNGKYPGYQFRFGGPWGGIPAGHLAVLENVGNDIIFTMTHVDCANEARNAGWPGVDCATGQDNIFVIPTMQSETGSSQGHPEDWATNPTWYEDDALGFMSLDYDEDHTETQERLLDYAWKRHRNPDATLQAYENNIFLTDDAGGNTVSIDENETLNFCPFGHNEKRNPDTNDYTITYANINWGVGGPSDVYSILNHDDISHAFESEGSFDVTLTIMVEPPGGGNPIPYSAAIPVDVADTDPDPPPGSKDDPIIEGSNVDLPDRYALHQNNPNPFNPSTTIHFDLPEPIAVKLAIYNIKGELVRTLVDERMTAGAKTVDWDGKNNLGSDVASGIYFYRIMTNAYVESRKMILIR